MMEHRITNHDGSSYQVFLHSSGFTYLPYKYFNNIPRALFSIQAFVKLGDQPF
jgi:hypothetical protein